MWLPWPFRKKVTGKRSEPAGPHGLRKVREAKEVPFEKESKDACLSVFVFFLQRQQLLFSFSKAIHKARVGYLKN